MLIQEVVLNIDRQDTNIHHKEGTQILIVDKLSEGQQDYRIAQVQVKDKCMIVKKALLDEYLDDYSNKS